MILAWPDLGLARSVIIGIVLILRGILFIIAGWQLHRLDPDQSSGPGAAQAATFTWAAGSSVTCTARVDRREESD